MKCWSIASKFLREKIIYEIFWTKCPKVDAKMS